MEICFEYKNLFHCGVIFELPEILGDLILLFEDDKQSKITTHTYLGTRKYHTII